MSDGDPSSPSFVRRALSGHAAIGLLAAALIYIVSLTGALVVMHDRLQRWEQPHIEETGPTLSPAAAQRAMENVVAAERGKPRSTHIYVRMPNPELPRASVSTDSAAWYIDAAGRTVGREAPVWTEFVIALHECLSLPATWGLLLVGATGATLLTALVTGALAHPRILRDAFQLRFRRGSRIARADWHNRLGVWALPFALAIAFTGAFLGLSSVGASLFAQSYTGGDIEEAYASIFGSEGRTDAAAAPLPDIARALASLASHAPQAIPTYVIVHDPGTRGQHVQIIAEQPRRLIYGETYNFDAKGRWLGKVGLSDGAPGQQFAASTYKLHFGNYGGLAIELAYIGLGLALCVMTSTGVTLWLKKRARRGRPSARLAAAWSTIVWGTPGLLLATFGLRLAFGSQVPFAGVFWITLGAALVIATVHPRWARMVWRIPERAGS